MMYHCILYLHFLFIDVFDITSDLSLFLTLEQCICKRHRCKYFFYHFQNSIKRDEGNVFIMMAYFLAVKTFNESLDVSTLLPVLHGKLQYIATILQPRMIRFYG